MKITMLATLLATFAATTLADINVGVTLPADNPVKQSATEYVGKYEAVHGKGSGYAWDAGILLANAAPVALKKAQPGSKEFRAALRDALEATKNVAGAHGVYNLSANDHLGLDQRARVMVTIKDGGWKLAK
jgi:branched-chain amino acid transport system substrate-binding protein